MSLQDPNVLEHELETVVSELMRDYRWLYHLAHDNPNTGEVKVSGGGPSNPTAGAVFSQSHVRSKLRWVLRRVKTAREILESAHRGLDKAFDIADRRCEPLNVSTDREATNAEVKAAHQAQMRRNQRGEGHGIA